MAAESNESSLNMRIISDLILKEINERTLPVTIRDESGHMFFSGWAKLVYKDEQRTHEWIIDPGSWRDRPPLL